MTEELCKNCGLKRKDHDQQENCSPSYYNKKFESQESCGKCKPDENCICKEFKFKTIIFGPKIYKANCEKCKLECEVKSPRKLNYYIKCLCGDKIILEENGE